MLSRCSFFEIKGIYKIATAKLKPTLFYCVSQGKPQWWRGTSYDKLAPTWDLVHDGKQGRIDWDEYETRYLEEILDREGAVSLLKAIWKAAQSQDVYLVCWEKTEKDLFDTKCHTIILMNLVHEMACNEKWYC